MNCAGVYTPKRSVTTEGFETMFATNLLGPFLLTNLVLPQLRAAESARVLVISAPSGTKLDFDDLQGERRFRSLTNFGASKAADLLSRSKFGAIIAIVSCYKGMTASGGAEGVGRAVNQGVVIEFLGIFAFNYVFTQTLLATHPEISVIK